MLIQLFISFALSEIAQPIHKVVIQGGEGGSKFYRIPSITMAPDNKTLIISADKRWNSNADLPSKIDTVIKYSKDNGVTWSEAITLSPGKADPAGYGDPGLIVDRQIGAVFCLFTGHQGTFASTKDKRQTNHYSVSHDNGVTWSPMIEITDMLYGTGCRDPIRQTLYSNFITSGNGIQLRNGRLMIVGVGRRDETRTLYDFAVYSDDHGKTWSMTANSPVTSGGDESKVVELNNGSILMSIRQSPNRLFSISNDGGLTWGYPVAQNDILEPWCNGDIIRYTSTKDGYNKNRLLHTIPYNTAGRKNLTIMVSYDEGNTWPVKKVIHPNSAAYSSVTFSPIDGKIYVFWERGGGVNGGFDLVVTTLTLDYITDGTDTWTPPNT